MKKFKVSLSIVLIILLFSFYAMAMDQPTVSTSNNDVKVKGKLEELTNVTLVVLDENNERQYLDQVKTDVNGNFEFEFSLEDGKYTGNVSTEFNQYEIIIEVKGGTSHKPAPNQPSKPGTYDDSTDVEKPVDVSETDEVEIRKTFKDTENHWAKNEIELLAGKGIISGMGDDIFKPEDKITRAQFATLIFNLLNLNEGNYTGKFSDVKENDWFALAVEAVENAGIVLGSDGLFNPNKEITREEMAVMIARTMVYKGVITDAYSVNFVDKQNISPWAMDSVGKACQKGIIKGMTETTFEPKLNATRAQAAVMIFRLVEVIWIGYFSS